jgi:very-short-patch-repair endonuclease
MKALRWTTDSASHDYMRGRQMQNLAMAVVNPNENWMRAKLDSTGLKWRRQAQWGYRLFDFWCGHLGCAVEVDGPEHDVRYDEHRDEYNFRRSGIVVIRVRNRNEDDASRALLIISRLTPLADRKIALGITGHTKAERRSLVHQTDSRRFHKEFLDNLR